MLDNKKIFPLYSTWPPTQKGYYNLFKDFEKNARNVFATPRSVMDLGCGTGVLGFILNNMSK